MTADQFECNGCKMIAEQMIATEGINTMEVCPECDSMIRAVICKGCKKVDVTDTKPSYHYWWRTDHYDIPTGHWCDECYADDHKYGYKRGAYYDYLEAGEYLEPEDY